MNATSRSTLVTLALLLSLLVPAQASAFGFGHGFFQHHFGKKHQNIELGPRPQWLIDDMDEDNPRSAYLKARLQQCEGKRMRRTDFSIGHRGAPLQFPEHTRESYIAAAKMGAGILECDVTFTKDKELVCRHAQCDLHQTTNILRTPLAAQCKVPPEFDSEGNLTNAAEVTCCTSDLTLAQFKTLEGKMDARDTGATTLEDFLNATADWRTDLYASKGTLMSHAESIALFQELGVKMTPELKQADDDSIWVDGDNDGQPDDRYFDLDGDGEVDFTREQLARKMIHEYKAAGVHPRKVYAQSFIIDDVLFWLDNEPRFGRQAVWLDGRYSDPQFDHTDPSTWAPNMREVRRMGINIIAPPMWMLVREGQHGIEPSTYARRARRAGLDIIAWTFERSAPLVNDGAWYHQTTDNLVNNDGDKMVTLDVLARDVGIRGIFSDWAAPVTYYANCMGLR